VHDKEHIDAGGNTMQNASIVLGQTRKLVLGALIAISVILLQTLMTLNQTDTAATVALIAFAIGIPFASLFFYISVLGEGIPFLDRAFKEKVLFVAATVVSSVGIFSEAVGIAAAIWHASKIAGIIFLICGSIVVFIWTRFDTWLAVKITSESEEV
jgi:hypothetical protein